jgi:hypothetical protein
MARRHYDPLACIPSPEVIRDKLHETLTKAERLRVLLELSERLRLRREEIDPPVSRLPLQKQQEAGHGE